MLAAADERVVKIVQITDLHILPSENATVGGVNTWACYKSVLALAQKNRWPPDLILCTGDLAHAPSREGYQRLRKSFESLALPCICLPGNHDDGELMAEIFHEENLSCLGQRVIDGWQILCLNSQLPGEERGHLDDGELERLEICLSRQPDKHALITLHHHTIPSGSRWLDQMVLDNSRDFFAILDRHPQVRAVLCGHIHQMMDSERSAIRFLGTPSTCFQFKPGSETFALDNAAPGYRWLELYPDGRIDTAVERLGALPLGLDLATAGY